MHEFSRSLAQLYELADQADPDEFPAAALAVVGRWVGFDGAVLGMGEAVPEAEPDLRITHAYVHQRDPGIVEGYAAISARDPVTAAFLRGLVEPLRVDCRATYAAAGLAPLDAYSRRHSLRHLMLFGDHPATTHSGRWLVLYRGNDRAFAAEDGEHLHAAWFHLSRAIGANRAAVLDRRDVGRARRALALVNLQGRIEVADSAFARVLREEWPAWHGLHLPQQLMERLAGPACFHGRRIEVTISRQGAWFVLSALAAGPTALLAPGEMAVARRFAAGQSHKQIARELGVSPHTVRTQIKRLYAKLDVHDKAEMAQRLMAQAS
jgi:DNA-binding CsgD family transcriptional regulator